MTKADRIKNVEKMIEVISSCGRRFFYSERKDRVARVEVDQRGRVWWIDEYTGKRIYTHYPYKWRGFSHGGTLKDLVQDFSKYIVSGKKLPSWIFGIAAPELGGDRWGYGPDNMEKIRIEAISLGMLAT